MDDAWFNVYHCWYLLPQKTRRPLGPLMQPSNLPKSYIRALLIYVSNRQFRSRGSTLRSKTRPEGDTTYPSVKMGNLQAARCAILILLAASKGVMWIMEQPRGSLLELHPMMQRVFRMLTVYRKSLNMMEYGGLTKKPTWLYSSGGPSKTVVI